MTGVGPAGARGAGDAIPASIELMARQAVEAGDLPGLFPPGTRVYLPDMGQEPDALFVAAARRVRDLGYVPVPHFAARRQGSRTEFQARIAALSGEAGVDDVLVIGGGLDRPAGDFASSLDLIATGLFDRYGVREIGIAGHPEGSPDFPEEIAYESLRLKQAFGERSDARLRIVTQFAFDAAAVIDWIGSLARHGVSLPVHVGVAGPCAIPTLIKYAVMCGIGNSLNLIRKQSSVLALAAGYSPETIVAPLERFWRRDPLSGIEQLHVFSFGGRAKTADWLKRRGSWADGVTASSGAAAAIRG